MKHLRNALFCTTALILASCDSPSDSNTPAPAAYLSSELDSIVVRSSNDLGFDLLRELSPAGTAVNTLVSPLSLSLAAGLMLNGARGATRDEMAATLGFAALSDSQINDSYRRILDVLYAADPQVEMIVANAVWCRDNFTPKQSFVDVNRLYLDALVRTLDFSLVSAADTINAWVAGQTNNRITGIVTPPIDPSAVLLAVNTLYLNAPWTKPFSEVIPDSFYAPQAKIGCALMKQRAKYALCVTDSFTAVELPYADSQFSMVVVLPAPDITLDRLLESLNAQVWEQWTRMLRPDSAILYVPAFQYSCDYNLNEPLIRLGLSRAFSPGADLSGIAENVPLYISETRQRTFISVSHTGTEVAAVTLFMMAMGMSPNPPIILRIDRPFLYVIAEKSTGTIMFLGSVYRPEYATAQ